MSGLLKSAQRLVNHLKSSSLVLGRFTYFITVVQVVVSNTKTARASDSMFLSIDFVRVTNCFYDYDYDLRSKPQQSI